MNKKVVVKALMDKDLEKLLSQTNQLDEFQNGEIECRICHCQMNIDNVGVIIPVAEENKALRLEFVCNNPNCLTSK